MSEVHEKPFNFLASTEGKEMDVKITDIDDYSINVRFANNLDIPSMVDWIHTVGGKILNRLWLWEPSEKDRLTYGITKKYVIIQGYRRFGGAKWIFTHPDEYSSSLVKSMEKLPAFVFKGIPYEEAENMVMDHGSTKPLAKSEVVNSVMRLHHSGHNATEISLRLAPMIIRDLKGMGQGSLEDFNKLTNTAERRDWINKNLKNTVTGYIIKAMKMGRAIGDQVLFRYKAMDGLLAPDDLVLFDATSGAIQELGRAQALDGDNFRPVNHIWIDEGTVRVDPNDCGTHTKGALIALVNKHFGKGETEPAERMMTKRDIEQFVPNAQSEVVRKALELVIRKGNANLIDLDGMAYKAEKATDVVKAFLAAGGFKEKPVQEVCEAFVSSKKIEDFIKTCSHHATPEVVKKAKEILFPTEEKKTEVDAKATT